ncbi:MAG TPA: flagellar motor protein MotB, partial [Thermodesulfobacteriota bacterium]|nr:flagellar motor protein MotB [Thermodesulfobacteriota bacterium]
MSGKRSRRSNDSGHGGSSWKVAYADFVTAMMAFFLILWLLSMVAPEKQALVSQYFQHFSIFERSGNSILDGSSNLREKVKKQTFHKGEQENVKKAPVLSINDPSIEPIPQENIQKKIREEVEKKLTNLKDQVLVDFFEGGVKIEMVDKVGSPMFPLG